MNFTKQSPSWEATVPQPVKAVPEFYGTSNVIMMFKLVATGRTPRSGINPCYFLNTSNASGYMYRHV
jgi:hypothetical protein